jgi:NO-binding membrane sensor protein with MHYT domain
MSQTGAALLGSCDYRLVVLSLLFAILASYVALVLVVCVMDARERDC